MPRTSRLDLEKEMGKDDSLAKLCRKFVMLAGGEKGEEGIGI